MFNRMKKVRKTGILLLALAVGFSFSGCGHKNDEDGPDSLLNNSTATSQSGSLSAEEEGIEFEAELSYANYEYIDSGDESVDKLIRNVKQTLTAKDTDEKLQIEAVLEALKKVPEDLKGGETFVTDAFVVNSMKFTGSSLVMDLSSDGLDSLGMYDEQFFIYQVTDSILNTFPDIEGVRFTVDGSNKDGLSYVDISSAFTASNIKSFLNEEDESSSEKKESETSKKSTESSTKEKQSDDADEDEDSQSTDTDTAAAKNSQKSKNSTSSDSQSSSGSSASGSQSSESSNRSSSSSKNSSSSGSSASSSKGSSSSGSTSSSNKSSSSTGSSSSANSNKNSSSSGSSSSSNKSSSSSGNSGSSTGSSSGSSGSQSSSSGSSSGSGSSSSSGSSTSSSGSSSSSTQDGVVNDDDL